MLRRCNNFIPVLAQPGRARIHQCCNGIAWNAGASRWDIRHWAQFAPQIRLTLSAGEVALLRLRWGGGALPLDSVAERAPVFPNRQKRAQKGAPEREARRRPLPC
jgi:hypothetical protein